MIAVLPPEQILERKFRWLVEPVLGQARTDTLVDQIWRFEQVTEVEPLLSNIVSGQL
jgi:hypothetical protein